MIDPKKFSSCDDNSCYTDGFPINDNPEKIDSIHSRDLSRPFDSGRSSEEKSAKRKHNYSGTTLDDPNQNKNKLMNDY